MRRLVPRSLKVPHPHLGGISTSLHWRGLLLPGQLASLSSGLFFVPFHMLFMRSPSASKPYVRHGSENRRIIQAIMKDLMLRSNGKMSFSAPKYCNASTNGVVIQIT